MDGAPLDAARFLSSCSERDVVRIVMTDGTTVEGSYLAQAGMHFVHVKDGSAVGRVEGPLDPLSIASCALLKSRAEVVEEIRERRIGEPVPGTLVETRCGYEARLERLANAAARAATYRRRMEIEAQFDEVADRISLARNKRKWMLTAAHWRLRSNEEPDKLEMSGGDMTAAERLARPRPQDFDPDPIERRRRPVLPSHVAEDPTSPPNMLKALRKAGFKARVSILSEMTHDGVDLLVDFPGGKKEGRFLVRGRRGNDGAMRWKASWEGGDSMTAARRRRRCMQTEAYRVLEGTVAAGSKPLAEEMQDDDHAAALSPRQ